MVQGPKEPYVDFLCYLQEAQLRAISQPDV